MADDELAQIREKRMQELKVLMLNRAQEWPVQATRIRKSNSNKCKK